MFRRLPDGTLQVSIRPPLIYLDHCALRGISSDPEKTRRIQKIFETRGTLMFSVVNMLEMAANRGQSYDEIRKMLDALGPYWVPSDIDPARVEANEALGAVMPKTFFPPLAIFGHIFRALPAETFSLGTALETIHDADFRQRAPDVLTGRPGFLKMLRELRARHSAGEKMLPMQCAAHTLPWIQQSLVRLLVTDGKKINKNDAVDLLHAVVPLRYAIVIVLDKAWASFSKRLGLKDGTHVFGCTPRDLSAALDCIETVDTSKFRQSEHPDVISS